MRTLSNQRPIRRFAVAALGATALAAALVTTGGAAFASSSPTVTNISVLVPSIPVTTSTGVKLDLAFDADDTPSDCSTCDDAATLETIELYQTHGSEEHSWQLIPQGDQVTMPSAGSPGAFDTGDNFDPIGEVAFSITPVSDPTDVMCGSTVGGLHQKVTVSGTAYFNTRTTGWGEIGSAAAPVAFTKNITIDTTYAHDCELDAGMDDCSLGTSYAIGGDSGALFSIDPKHLRQFFFVHDFPMAHAPYAEREDQYVGTLASAKLTRHGKRATLKIKGAGGLTTGSGTLHGKRKPIQHFTCGPKHTKVKEYDYEGTFKNGHKPFEVHSKVFGVSRLRNGDQASIWIDHKR